LIILLQITTYLYLFPRPPTSVSYLAPTSTLWSQIRPFQGKKLTYTPLNFNTWKPNTMNQLEANFHQLGRAIPTGEWPNYIAQFREARTIGRRNYSTTRKPVILSVNPNPLPHAPTATSLKDSNAEDKDPDGDASSMLKEEEGQRGCST
jgi:hypothetical protein